MKEYLKKWLQELNAYTEACGNDRPAAILEQLWYCYSAVNTVDDGLVRQREDALKPIFEALPVETSDDLFDMITDLVTAYQRAAFLEGMQVGAQLTAGLWEY